MTFPNQPERADLMKGGRGWAPQFLDILMTTTDSTNAIAVISKQEPKNKTAKCFAKMSLKSKSYKYTDQGWCVGDGWKFAADGVEHNADNDCCGGVQNYLFAGMSWQEESGQRQNDDN
jgi:hypothetical protein